MIEGYISQAVKQYTHWRSLGGTFIGDSNYLSKLTNLQQLHIKYNPPSTANQAFPKLENLTNLKIIV